MKTYPKYRLTVSSVSSVSSVFLLLLCALTLALALGQPRLQAQENPEGKQKRASKLSGMQTRIDGVLYSGLEHWDPSERASNDPRDQASGFTITRAYLNFRGDAINPIYKGWGYRLTLDFAPAATLGNGCNTNSTSTSTSTSTPRCARNNDLDAYFKYAYFFLPLSKSETNAKHRLIIGQQETPFAASLQKIWGYRHVARSVLRQARVAESADRGIGLVSEYSNVIVHFLLANGEGYHRNNAEPGATNASQALDFYGNISLFGSESNNQHSIFLHIPFRLYNVIGLKDREKDTGELNAAQDLGRLRGFGRGVELNYVHKSNNNGDEFRLGFGQYFINRPGGHNGGQGANGDGKANTYIGERKGRIGYTWLTFQAGVLGGFYSYYETTSTEADGRLVALSPQDENGRAIRRIYGLNFRPNINVAFLNISLGEDSVHTDSASGTKDSRRGDVFLRFGLSFELYNSGTDG